MTPGGLVVRSVVLMLAFTGVAGSPLASQWPAGRGAYWMKASVFHHATTEQYRSSGAKRPFLAPNAESRSSAVFFDALYGVNDRLDLWLQVPYFDLRFDDDIDDRHSTGIGDVRLSARYNLLRLRGGSVPISMRLTAKVPVVDFPIDSEVIPVGEGQWDYEAWVEAGVSLWPLPAYSVLWLGYRWRTLNEKTTRDPGDEVAVLGEIGGTLVGPFGGKVVVDAILGRSGAIQGVRVPKDRREILYLQPTAIYQATPAVAIEAGARFPLRGRNFPAGPQLFLGVFHRPPTTG